MAKRKGKSDGKGPKRRRPSGTGPENLPDLPDPHLLEGLMRQLLGRVAEEPGTPQARALDLLDQAHQEPDAGKRAELARQALQVWPDCADAYVLLAEQAPSRKETLALFEQGVAAGQRALGEQGFREAEGHFWGVLETRPYMRARQGLAHTLWLLGRRDEAVGHLQDMLRLNPQDNQGQRHTLAAWLLTTDRDDELEQLLRQYPDEGSAVWAYATALLAFRRQGDTPEAGQLLKQARKCNKYVPAFLLGLKPFPPEQPDYYSPGDVNEAVMCASGMIGAWKSTPGALAWLRAAQARRKKRARPAPPPPQGPLPLVKERLRRLPQELDVWQADCRPFPVSIRVSGELVRPWATLVVSSRTDLILGQHLSEEEPSTDQLWDILAEAMTKPLAGEAHRPSELQLRSGTPWEALKLHVQDLDVDCTLTGKLDFLDALFEDMGQSVLGSPQPGLLDAPGVTPEQVGRLYEAAAQFYRRAPWRSLGHEDLVKIECARFQSGPWYGVIMGQGGMTFGLALYEDLNLLNRLRRGTGSAEQNARETVALTLTYVEEAELSAADAAAVERHGWPVAQPEAFPSVFRKERGLSMRPPLAWELDLMEGCLRALPDFVARHRPDNPSPEQVTVPVASGELTLTLTWVGEK